MSIDANLPEVPNSEALLGEVIAAFGLRLREFSVNRRVVTVGLDEELAGDQAVLKAVADAHNPTQETGQQARERRAREAAQDYKSLSQISGMTPAQVGQYVEDSVNTPAELKQAVKLALMAVTAIARRIDIEN